MVRLPFLISALLWLPALAAGANTVLVLPFFNESKSENLGWIGESIAEHTRESLDSEGLLVASREDRLEASRRLGIRPGAILTRASVIKIGEALDASTIIYGYFDVSPAAPQVPVPAAAPAQPESSPTRGSLRITVRILDLQHTKAGPEFIQTGALEDLASLEMHLAWQSLRFLAPKSARSEEDFRRDRPPIRVDAIESYIRGLLSTAPEQQHRLFTQAARLDNRFSQPCFQLGQMAWSQKEYSIAAGWLARVSRADSHYLDAVFLLGLCRFYIGEFAKSQESFEIVAAAAPLEEVFNNLGAVQSRLGLPGAVNNFQKALDGDSADPDYQFNLGYVLWKRGDFDAAAERFRAALDRRPDDSEAVSWLGRCLKREGPRAGDPRSQGRERLKPHLEVTAYRQLKAELQPKP